MEPDENWWQEFISQEGEGIELKHLQLLAPDLLTKWKIGKPIDVLAFLDREDVPQHMKDAVNQTLRLPPGSTNAEQANSYRQAQAQIMIEIYYHETRET